MTTAAIPPSDPAPAARRDLDVLVVDDERNIRTTLRACLEALGCTVAEADSARAALDAAQRRSFDLAFLDLRLGADDGLDVLPRLLAAQPSLAIVVITAHATTESTVRAIRLGAADYLPKPFTPDQVRLAVEKAAAHGRARSHIASLEKDLAAEIPEANLATQSAAMQSALAVIARAAAFDAPVLLRGESGTGKGLLARALHAQSPRRKRPFVTVNCPLLSETLLASELFGHVRGAFTGAERDQQGRVEAAEGGTLFLDEIAEMPPALQAKLLRFLQEKRYERVGETRSRTADVRIVAATNADLERAVAEGRFREDLFFRLNVVEVRVPALRERREDIPQMARGLLRHFAAAAKRPGMTFADDAESALAAHAWPGNVRELRNVIERAVILSPATTIGVGALPERFRAAKPAQMQIGGAFTLDEVEREHILSVLAKSASLDDAARTLGIDASTLWRKRKRYGV